MMCSCYILYSPSLNTYYIGITQVDLQERIDKHNSSFYDDKNFTKRASDWQLYFQIRCETYSQARKIELHIKRMKSKKFIENLKLYPEIVNRLLITYEK